MIEQNVFSFILFICAAMMFLMGWVYFKKTPKYSKDYKGLTKSKYESRSEVHWNFSHKKSGKLYMKSAGFLSILGIIGIFLDLELKIGFIIGIAIVLIGCTIIRIKVDNALIEKFGK